MTHLTDVTGAADYTQAYQHSAHRLLGLPLIAHKVDVDVNPTRLDVGDPAELRVRQVDRKKLWRATVFREGMVCAASQDPDPLAGSGVIAGW